MLKRLTNYLRSKLLYNYALDPHRLALELCLLTNKTNIEIITIDNTTKISIYDYWLNIRNNNLYDCIIETSDHIILKGSINDKCRCLIVPKNMIKSISSMLGKERNLLHKYIN